MMDNHAMMNDDIQWAGLVRQVAEHFSDLTIKRGFQYYKQGRVHELMAPDHGPVEAVVQENGASVRVKLNLGSLEDSECSCGENGCSHKIAVLLQYAALEERPLYNIVNAHSAELVRRAVQPPPRLEAGHTSRTGPAIEDMSAAQWHSLFGQCTASLGSGTQPAQYANQALKAIFAVKPPLVPVLEQLYGLHAHLFVLDRLIGPPPGAARSAYFYLGYHTQIAADEIQAAIRISLSEELAIEGHPEHWSMLTGTLDYMRERMLNESGGRLQYFPDIYYRFWQQWLAPRAGGPEMFREELRQLEAAEEAKDSGPARVPRLLARCWMYVFLGRDEEAWRLLKEAGGSSTLQLPPAQLLLLMSHLHGKGEWARLVDGLTAIGPLLGPGSLDEYLAYWRAALEHLPESGLEARMWDTLTSMLPLSGGIYAQALLERGRYRQWMDYQLSTGAEPLDYRVTELQVIERHAPELLLPFYHQAVERYVLLKNRHDYKAAVKLLKRLAKLYKKMKLEDRWEAFFSSFASRHGRLRALQEELRKGKLLS
jgi:tetratricopeptide (TPR) repeat protein